MSFKKNWGSMAEKDPPFGRFDIFQTSPKSFKYPAEFSNSSELLATLEG